MNEITVVSCPRCRTRVRLRGGDEEGRCEACNTVVQRAGRDGPAGAPSPERPSARGAEPRDASLTPSVVLVGSLLLIGAGAVALRMYRHPRPPPPPSLGPETVYTAPPAATPREAPAGEIAWEPESRAPVLVAANADETEDIFGFFRVWDGRSAWTFYGGLFDGASLSPLWRSEPIDPQILKHRGVSPSALAVGHRVVVSDTTPLLRVFDLEKGTKLLTLEVLDNVVAMCKAPDPAPRIWVQVAGDEHALVDVETGKATFGPHPSWCSLPPPPPREKEAPGLRKKAIADAAAPNRVCVDDFRNGLARATCSPGDAPAVAEGIVGHYVLRSGPASVLLATKEDRPVAVGLGGDGKASWSTPLVADETKPVPEAPHIADVADGRLYAVYAKVYFDARLVALDASTGARVWDVPLVGSLPSGSPGDVGRGMARGLLASKSRVYVARSGGGLDVFDARDGKAIGTIGKK